jgi:hypothetical protein
MKSSKKSSSVRPSIRDDIGRRESRRLSAAAAKFGDDSYRFSPRFAVRGGSRRQSTQSRRWL